MDSVVSSLGDEREAKLQNLFSRLVRFHLLYKSNDHGATIKQLLNSFDSRGKFVLVLFQESGSIRGGYTSKSLKHGKQFADTDAFVFEINKDRAKKFPVLKPDKAVDINVPTNQPKPLQHSGSVFGHASFGQPVTPVQSVSLVSFGSCLQLQENDQSMHANFGSDGIYGTGWIAENSVVCTSVELHRVQDVGDLLPMPWRELSWTDKTRESLMKDFVSYKMLLESLPQIKVLLLGPVGSGKSSLINSIRSTMYKRIVHLPNIGTAVDGFTQKLTTYHIREVKGRSPTVLSLCDVMAVGDEDSPGLSLSDALAVIKGYVPEGYKFQRDFSISDTVSGYKAAPTLNDQIHCVLFVLDASKLTSYTSSLKSMLRKLHTSVSGIPQLIVLTHVDQVCQAVQEDVKFVYSSRIVQQKMQKAAEVVGLPLSYVLPIKNYDSLLAVDCNADILLLSAVINILHAVNDTHEDQYPDLIKKMLVMPD
ncbi:interferon-induced protein 44-like [Trichomycterus rosablanca]|uniref:interferon-induced protein 44-like n=1 Tax=Trichomycterus rosablanca TaxID=2290929 RepID=UPI002F358BF1